MSSGANVFEISDIQGGEAEAVITKNRKGAGVGNTHLRMAWSEAQLGTSAGFCREQDGANREELRRVRY
jgi:hypothetical protein